MYILFIPAALGFVFMLAVNMAPLFRFEKKPVQLTKQLPENWDPFIQKEAR